jgi:hypothetical protein
MSIPLVDLAARHAEVADEAGEVDIGLSEVFATTAFIGGKAVNDF